jgi:acyl-CoA reductase-like NAD-dependent aldehyde dehydrogenase
VKIALFVGSIHHGGRREKNAVPVCSSFFFTMGRAVGPRLAARFARAILELGGNNAAIVAPSADLDLAVRAIAFAAMGTAGQRLHDAAAALRACQCL